MSEDALRSILIAGVGNAWLRDDGFGGEVARRLSSSNCPPGVRSWTPARAGWTSPTR